MIPYGTRVPVAVRRLRELLHTSLPFLPDTYMPTQHTKTNIQTVHVYTSQAVIYVVGLVGAALGCSLTVTIGQA